MDELVFLKSLWIMPQLLVQRLDFAVLFLVSFFSLFSSSQTRFIFLYLYFVTFLFYRDRVFSYSAQFLKVSSGCWRSHQRLQYAAALNFVAIHFYKPHLTSFERIIKCFLSVFRPHGLTLSI